MAAEAPLPSASSVYSRSLHNEQELTGSCGWSPPTALNPGRFAANCEHVPDTRQAARQAAHSQRAQDLSLGTSEMGGEGDGARGRSW